MEKPRRMQIELPIGNDPASVRRRMEAMEQLLENAIVGLVPVLGDLVTTAMGAWLVWEARNLGMPKWKLWRMAGNVAFDTALGAVPLVGDAADFMFRSNTRNMKIVRRHLDKHHPAQRTIDQ